MPGPHLRSLWGQQVQFTILPTPQEETVWLSDSAPGSQGISVGWDKVQGMEVPFS